MGSGQTMSIFSSSLVSGAAVSNDEGWLHCSVVLVKSLQFYLFIF